MPTAAALAAAVMVGACADTGEQESGQAAAVAAPTLVEIMKQLETDMERVAHGVWVEDFDSIAAGAQAVADHPEVGPDERAEILGALGEGGAGFRAADMAVHNTAVELAEAAATEDIGRVLELVATVQEQCVACHLGYRDRLKAARQ